MWKKSFARQCVKEPELKWMHSYISPPQVSFWLWKGLNLLYYDFLFMLLICKCHYKGDWLYSQMNTHCVDTWFVIWIFTVNIKHACSPRLSVSYVVFFEYITYLISPTENTDAKFYVLLGGFFLFFNWGQILLLWQFSFPSTRGQ